MSKTLKQICDAASIRAGFGSMSEWFGANDETLAYLSNESVNYITRYHKWQALRKTATITMTSATLYDLPDDIKYYVSETMNAVDNERYIDFPAPTREFWYFKTHSPQGILYKVRQVGDQLEILNPDSGTVIKFEYISSKVITGGVNSTTKTKAEFEDDTDVWTLDDELIILDLKWRYMAIKGVEGWEAQKMVFNEHLQRVVAQDGGSGAVDFCQPTEGRLSVPYTDLYI